MSRYKTWMIAGCITGSATVLLFAGLAIHVFLSNPPMTSHIAVLGLLAILLGMTSTCLLIGGNMCRWMAEQSEELANRRWWKGYSAAVEDLEGPTADVLKLPAPANRVSRRG